MALSRKHFEAVAAVLDGQRRVGPNLDEWDAGWEQSRSDLAAELAAYFATENPNFDRVRFLTASGVAR